MKFKKEFFLSIYVIIFIIAIFFSVSSFQEIISLYTFIKESLFYLLVSSIALSVILAYILEDYFLVKLLTLVSFVSFGFLVVLTTIIKPQVKIIVENPTYQTKQITYEGKTLHIAPFSSKTLEFLSTSFVIDEEKITKKGLYILNLGLPELCVEVTPLFILKDGFETQAYQVEEFIFDKKLVFVYEDLDRVVFVAENYFKASKKELRDKVFYVKKILRCPSQKGK